MRGIIYIGVLLMLFSCQKQQDWDFEEGPLPDIVVEGMFTNESKVHEVFLSLPVENLTDSVVPVTGATVRIIGSDTNYVLSENPLRPGSYLTDSNAYGIVGESYTLEINYNSKTYSATDELNEAVFFTPVILNMTNEIDSIYEVAWVCHNYDPQNPALYELFLDWRHVDGFDSTRSFAVMYFYTLASIDVAQFLVGTDERVLFPKGTKIRERRYSISAEYAEFLREVIIETQYNSGLVNMIPANTFGNVTNNGAGFFSCGGVLEYTGVAGD